MSEICTGARTCVSCMTQCGQHCTLNAKFDVCVPNTDRNVAYCVPDLYIPKYTLTVFIRYSTR